MEYRLIDEGYAKSGIFWQIKQPKLRYAKIWSVLVNGVQTDFRSRDEAYAFLEETGTTSFHKHAKQGKVEYEYKQKTVEELQEEERLALAPPKEVKKDES